MKTQIKKKATKADYNKANEILSTLRSIRPGHQGWERKQHMKMIITSFETGIKISEHNFLSL